MSDYNKRHLKIACELAGVDYSKITSIDRHRHIATERHLFINALRKNTQFTMSEIGEMFNRDHSTISTSCEAAEALIFTDKDMKARYKKYTKAIKQVFDPVNPTKRNEIPQPNINIGRRLLLKKKLKSVHILNKIVK